MKKREPSQLRAVPAPTAKPLCICGHAAHRTNCPSCECEVYTAQREWEPISAIAGWFPNLPPTPKAVGAGALTNARSYLSPHSTRKDVAPMLPVGPGLIVLALCLHQAACGGAPFSTETFDAGPAVEAETSAPDVADASDSGGAESPEVDAGGEAETSTARDAYVAPEVDAYVTPPVDAYVAPACTPLTTTFPYPSGCGGSSVTTAITDQYFVLRLGVGSDGYPGCEEGMTPSQCQCQETYNCECILAHADYWQSACLTTVVGPGTCSVSTGTPTVTCP